jgi:hypothetical protein
MMYWLGIGAVHAQLVYASGMYVYTHVLFLDGVSIHSNEALYGDEKLDNG